MKTVKMLVFFVMVMVSGIFSSFGQELPKGDFPAEPSVDQTPYSEVHERTNFVSGVAAYWGEGESVFFHAQFDSSGTAINLTLNTGERSYEFPTNTYREPFGSADLWKKFAVDLRNRFQVIGEGIYMETNLYEFVGKSTYLADYEIGGQALVFKTGSRLLAAPRFGWVGELPEVGAKVLIGRSKDDGEMFFQVFRVGKSFATEPTVGIRIAEERAANNRLDQELAKSQEGRKTSATRQADGSYLLPKLVVEGREDSPPK